MIEVGFDSFLQLYVVIGLLALASCWGRHLWKNSVRQWNVSEDSLCRCSNCGLIFVAKRVESVTRCPACNELARIRPKKAHKKMTY